MQTCVLIGNKSYSLAYLSFLFSFDSNKVLDEGMTLQESPQRAVLYRTLSVLSM